MFTGSIVLDDREEQIDVSGHPFVFDDFVVHADPVIRAGRDAVESGLKRSKPERQFGRVDPNRRKLFEDFDDSRFSESPFVECAEIGPESQKFGPIFRPE